MEIFPLVSHSPLTASSSGSAPEGLMPRRESLWLGEERGGVRVALRLAQGACMVSLSNHPPLLYPVRYGFLFSPVI